MIFGRGRPSLKVSGEGILSEMMAGVRVGLLDFLLPTIVNERQRTIEMNLCAKCLIVETWIRVIQHQKKAATKTHGIVTFIAIYFLSGGLTLLYKHVAVASSNLH